jgi:hypothetical protein
MNASPSTSLRSRILEHTTKYNIIKYENNLEVDFYQQIFKHFLKNQDCISPPQKLPIVKNKLNGMSNLDYFFMGDHEIGSH